MNRSFFAALSIGAAALLAACGGSQQIAQTASPQVRGEAASTPLPGGAVSHGAMRHFPRLPQSSQPLLYLGNDDPNAVDIFPLTGPNQQQIGSITNGVNRPWGLSLDANGALYVANDYPGTVNVYPPNATDPSTTYSGMYVALYALADSKGHVFVTGESHHRLGHVLEFAAGRNRVIAHQKLGSETDGMAIDGQGNLYVAYRPRESYLSSSIAEFGPRLNHMRLLGMSIDEPQGLLVDHAGNIIVVESTFGRIDVFPPGATTPSVTLTIPGVGHLAQLAMQNNETTLFVSSEEGFVYSMPYPLTPSTVPTEYEQISSSSNGIAISPY